LWETITIEMYQEFKWRHFKGEIILWAVRWYCKYGISYRDLEEMMNERGVEVDHTTLYRWFCCNKLFDAPPLPLFSNL